MCLVTHARSMRKNPKRKGRYFHSSSDAFLVRHLTARRDWIMWKKVLPFVREALFYEAPFRGTRHVFGQLNTTSFEPSELSSARRNTPINRGFHGFVKQKLKGHWRNGRLRESQWIPCLIPKGTHVIWGRHGDCVVEAMIPFKTLDDLKNFCRKQQCA